MKFLSAFPKCSVLVLAAVVGGTVSTAGMFAEAEPGIQTANQAPVGDEFVFPRSQLEPATHSWREIVEFRPSHVCRVRFQIGSTATSVDEQLMLAANNNLDAIILEPQQPSEKKSNRRFEIAIVGKARMDVQRLGLFSSDFKDKWIEVIGFPRHYNESWTHGNVAVSQFVVSDLDSIEVHDSNWQGTAFE